MNQASFLIILDGFRLDYIKRMPFLSSIYNSLEIKPTPSFCFRPMMLSGNDPIKTNTFADFVYSKKSPYKGLQIFKFKPVLKLRSDVNRWLLSMAPYLFNKRRVDPFNIPFSMLQYFDISSEYLNYSDDESNLFKELKRNGYNVVSLNDATNPIKEMDSVFDYNPNKTVFLLHYNYQENICFKYGIESQEMTNYLKKIDNSLKKIILSFDCINLMIVGDHGMTPVKINFNLWAELNKLNSKLNDDYIFFLNSPTARFWFFNKKAKEEVLKLLLKLNKFGVVLSKEDLIKFKIPSDKKYGEIIFFAREGVNISPDFYHFDKIKAMHGYLNEAGPPLILYSTNKNLKIKKDCNLIDITPTFLKLLGIKTKIKMQGRSIL